MEWIEWIFDSTSFAPRFKAGAWDDFHLYMYLAASIGVSFLKVTTPVIWLLLWTPVMRMQAVDGHKLWILRKQMYQTAFLYGCFIGLTGIGRFLNDVTSFWWPAYRFYAWVHFITFLMGIAATIYLVKIISQEIILLRDSPPTETPRST